jgi:hypothetical protein
MKILVALLFLSPIKTFAAEHERQTTVFAQALSERKILVFRSPLTPKNELGPARRDRLVFKKTAQVQIVFDQVTFCGSLIKLGTGQRKP